jgi:hypothetical protein
LVETDIGEPCPVETAVGDGRPMQVGTSQPSVGEVEIDKMRTIARNMSGEIIDTLIEELSAATQDREHRFDIRPDVWDVFFAADDRSTLFLGQAVALRSCVFSKERHQNLVYVGSESLGFVSTETFESEQPTKAHVHGVVAKLLDGLRETVGVLPLPIQGKLRPRTVPVQVESILGHPDLPEGSDGRSEEEESGERTQERASDCVLDLCLGTGPIRQPWWEDEGEHEGEHSQGQPRQQDENRCGPKRFSG